MFPRFRIKGLWRHPNFVKLWVGSTISLFGSQVTFLALPFTAALILHANALQMGLLTAANTVPFLLGGLFAGVWVDRLRRRPLLIGADIGRALLLGSIPLVALVGHLHIEYLYVVAFLVGILTLVFDLAYGAFLPSLIERELLLEGNSALQASTSVAEFAGPSLAGVLVQVFTAPVALLADAFSFLASATALFSLRVKEVPRKTEAEQQHFWREMAEGLRFVLNNSVLRALVASAGTLNFTGGVFDALLVLYVTRHLGLGAAFFGVMYTVGSLSGIGGAFLATLLTKRLGTAKVAFVSAILIALGWLCIPLANGALSVVIASIVVGMLIAGMGNTLFNIAAQTLVQTSTPDHLLGRVHSSATVIGVGSLPVGALLGGILGSLFGLRPVLLAAALVRFVLLALFLTPLWKRKEETSPTN